jgi:hypothetical protein
MVEYDIADVRPVFGTGRAFSVNEVLVNDLRPVAAVCVIGRP